MTQRDTITSELEKFMKEQGYTFQYFSKITGINVGTLSALVNGNRSIAMGQLDKITAGMGLPEDAFFDLYIEECFLHSPPNWRRLKPFLYRSAELNRIDCIERVIDLTMDTLAYIPQLFETAEDFFRLGYAAASIVLYRTIAESEKYQHSERLALCQYRIFLISIGDDHAQNLRAAAQFECYIDRLDEAIELDAIKDLADVYLSLRDWERLDKLAHKMTIKAQAHYHFTHHSSKNNSLTLKTKRPLFLYIIYGYLLRSVVCEEQGDYQQALNYTSLYSDLDWVEDTSEEAMEIVAQYKELALANTYLYQLMIGRLEILPSYLAYMGTQQDEVLPALSKIIQAARQYDYDIKPILEAFHPHIIHLDLQQMITGISNKQARAEVNQYTYFLTELASFYLDKDMYNEGIKSVLDGLTLAVQLNSEAEILKCVGLFEKYRYTASQEAQHQYHSLISEMGNHHSNKDYASITN